MRNTANVFDGTLNVSSRTGPTVLTSSGRTLPLPVVLEDARTRQTPSLISNPRLWDESPPACIRRECDGGHIARVIGATDLVAGGGHCRYQRWGDDRTTPPDHVLRCNLEENGNVELEARWPPSPRERAGCQGTRQEGRRRSTGEGATADHDAIRLLALSAQEGPRQPFAG